MTLKRRSRSKGSFEIATGSQYTDSRGMLHILTVQLRYTYQILCQAIVQSVLVIFIPQEPRASTQIRNCFTTSADNFAAVVAMDANTRMWMQRRLLRFITTSLPTNCKIAVQAHGRLILYTVECSQPASWILDNRSKKQHPKLGSVTSDCSEM